MEEITDIIPVSSASEYLKSASPLIRLLDGLKGHGGITVTTATLTRETAVKNMDKNTNQGTWSDVASTSRTIPSSSLKMA